MTIAPAVPEGLSHDGLRRELRRVDALFADHLHALRERGRSTLGDLVKGCVIEDGEAEGLLRELAADHGDSPPVARESEPSVGALPSLDHATRVFGLAGLERDALLLGLAVEIDSRYARLVAYLNDHAERARPTVGLLSAIRGEERTAGVGPFLPGGSLHRYGLVELEGDGPLSGRAYRVPESFWPRLLGHDVPATLGEIRRGGADHLDRLIMPDAVRARAVAAAAWIATDHADPRLVLLKGPPGSGRETIACAIAHAARRPALVVQREAMESPAAVALLRRETLWYGAVLVVVGEATTPTRAAAHALRGLDAPAIWVSGESAETLLTESRRSSIEVGLEELGVDLRAALLRHFLPLERCAADVDLHATAAHFRFGPGRTETVARMATAHVAAFGEGGRIDPEHLAMACRSLPEVRLAALAQRLACPFTREDLVVPPETARELDLAMAWHRSRGKATRLWADGQGRGLACLFTGPPGTGKTMGAQVLARQMGLDVYRIDLSQMVSKYIGETEKNLSRTFDEARAASVILFFDEADALFGKRTEVKDAHDRYANVETGYLLQRIEQHDGICILATNLHRNMDEAFLRRLQIIAEFPMPGEAERLRIWRRHMPQPELCADDLDLPGVAKRFTVSGGEIRNTVMTAALLAADDGGLVTMRHLALGLSREMRKGGRVLDASEFGPWTAPVKAG